MLQLPQLHPSQRELPKLPLAAMRGLSGRVRAGLVAHPARRAPRSLIEPCFWSISTCRVYAHTSSLSLNLHNDGETQSALSHVHRSPSPSSDATDGAAANTAGPTDDPLALLPDGAVVTLTGVHRRQRQTLYASEADHDPQRRQALAWKRELTESVQAAAGWTVERVPGEGGHLVRLKSAK